MPCILDDRYSTVTKFIAFSALSAFFTVLNVEMWIFLARLSLGYIILLPFCIWQITGSLISIAPRS